MSKTKKPALVRSKSKNYDRETISEGIYFYQSVTHTFSEYSINYEIENNRFTALSFSLDFAGSENIEVYRYDGCGNGPEVLVPGWNFTILIKPFSTVRLGYCKRSVATSKVSVYRSCSCRFEQPDDKATVLFLSNHRIEMKLRLEQAENANFPPDRADVDGSDVKKISQEKNVCFTDLAFPPIQQSIFLPSQVCKFSCSEDQKRFEQVEWKRPPEFMKPLSQGVNDKATIRVFEDGIEAADILQGNLGDCWFLSSLAALAEHPSLVEALIPPFSREYNDAGVYFVRFCKNGLWTTVRVDDYIPCYPDSGPIFSKSHGNELWVLLVEKAYAKLHGSYLSIQTGQSYDALMDLTGAPYQIIQFPTEVEERKDRSKMDIIWNKLVEGMKNHYLMSAGTRDVKDVPFPINNCSQVSEETEESKENAIGLVFNHGYTVLAVRETSKGDRILKLR
jgi:hypothetical protein